MLSASLQARREAGVQRTLYAVACKRLFGPYAPAQPYNGKDLHSVTVLPPLPH
jgi:hypothetical protein